MHRCLPRGNRRELDLILLVLQLTHVSFRLLMIVTGCLNNVGRVTSNCSPHGLSMLATLAPAPEWNQTCIGHLTSSVYFRSKTTVNHQHNATIDMVQPATRFSEVIALCLDEFSPAPWNEPHVASCPKDALPKAVVVKN